jgi:2-polyprenyl-3-methyl-5-hydroxy-6-metoxy-1,4-benzoquinol methylase
MGLTDFYDKKYEQEKTVLDIEHIPYVKYPVNRSQACFKYFIDHFKGGDILELASGSGAIAKSILSSELNVKTYLASDWSVSRLEGMKKTLNDERLQIAQIDAENIDLNKYNKFDAIIMVALIEHLIDPLKAMKTIGKLLKPGGFVYIDTPNIADYGARFKLLRGIFPSTASKNEGLIKYNGEPVDLIDEGHLHYFTYRSLSSMLLQYCDFTSVEKYAFPIGKLYLGKKIHSFFAQKRPELFSELVLIAYK